MATLKSKSRFNIKFVVLITVVVAAIGAYFLFFASAAPNNCQTQNGVQICDVDEALNGTDTVLSTNSWAADLGKQGFLYFGAAFRAPTSPLPGTQPVYSVNNPKYSYRDYLFDAGVKSKQATYPSDGVVNEGVVFHAWPAPGTANTVPVYKMDRGGSSLQTVYSTDRSWVDKMLAQDANNSSGWKDKGIAFYAYPPNYAVSSQPNPYDCSIQANFVSDRCATQRQSLQKAVADGAIPKDNSCPKTLDAYIKAPFPGQFTADCQRFWNTYMKDCSVTENFVSDRCKDQRAAIIKAQEEQARLRAEAAARAAAASRASSGSRGGSGGGSGSGSGGSGGGSGSGSGVDCSKDFYSDACASARAAFSALATAQSVSSRTANVAAQREQANYNARQAQNQRDYNNRVGYCYFYNPGGKTNVEKSTRKSCSDRNGTFKVK